MPRGGFRPGAGRKAKKAVAVLPITVDAEGFKTESAPENWPFGMERPVDEKPADTVEMTPLEYLLYVMRNPDASDSQRITAAIQAAPYCHTKKADIAKKSEKGEAAKKASTGKFKAAPAPLKLVSNGK